MSEMHLTVHGRLVNAPQLRTTRDRRPFTTFRVATNGRHPIAGSPGTYEDGPTSFLSVTAFGDLGANAYKSLSQGQPVVVTGVLRIREFARADGSPGMSADIRALSLGHDLTWGVTSFTKVRRGSYGEGDPLDQPEVAGALGEMYEGSVDGRQGEAGQAPDRRGYGSEPEQPGYGRGPEQPGYGPGPERGDEPGYDAYDIVGGPDEDTGEIHVAEPAA